MVSGSVFRLTRESKDFGIWGKGEESRVCMKERELTKKNRFNDQVQDALVWHDGVRIEGEKVSGGVQRVLSRIAESGLEEDGGDAWEGMGGIYRGVGSG